MSDVIFSMKARNAFDGTLSISFKMNISAGKDLSGWTTGNTRVSGTNGAAPNTRPSRLRKSRRFTAARCHC